MEQRLVFDSSVVRAAVGTGTPDREIEARMGQYVAAFGSGAGDARITRQVVDILRYRYLPCVRDVVATQPEAWEHEAAHVLALMRGVGRLAASFALSRGEITILAYDAWVAAGLVEAATRDKEAEGGLGGTRDHPHTAPRRPTWCKPPAKRGGTRGKRAKR